MGTIILAVAIIFLLIKYTESQKQTSKNKQSKRKWNNNWKWNEQTQMWEHPDGQKIKPNATSENPSANNPYKETTNFHEYNYANEDNQEDTNENHIDYTREYQPRYLLTKNEWHQYMKLREVADIRNMVICPKVRLLDIIEPRNGCNNYMACLGKIKSKHVDFVICDPNMHIKAIIELDDNSHESVDRKERDRFVNQALTNAGYKVIRTKYINHDILDSI